MQKYQINSTTLVLAAVAAALALLQLSGNFAWMSSIGGLILVVILFAFDQEGYRGVFQSLAFAAVCGFCTALATGVIYQILAGHGEVHLDNNRWATEYLPLTCAFATAIYWAIDMMRMNARKVAPIHVPRALGETTVLGMNSPAFSQMPAPVHQPAYYAPQPQQYAPPQPYTPPQPQQPVAAPVYPQRVETFAPPPQPVAPPLAQPAIPPRPAQPAYEEAPTATSIFSTINPIEPATVPTPAMTEQPVAAQPLSPGPASIISHSGKETLIYVSLLGEGLNVLRSVRAEPLGRDYYRIIDEMPEGETWQFQPGQVVRCKKRNLSSGKAMVAMEEAPRAT